MEAYIRRNNGRDLNDAAIAENTKAEAARNWSMLQYIMICDHPEMLEEEETINE